MKRYFTYKEMTRSATAKRLGIDNTQTTIGDCMNMLALIDNVLNPLREAYGKPIQVTSGYRCKALNEAVGGAKNSDHLKGMAADIVGTPNNPTENKRLFMLVSDLKLPYKQLIDEKDYSWVHISYDPNNIKRQILHL